MTNLEFLRRRNKLWAELRGLEPGTPQFEQRLAELAALIRWPREKVLAGLGLAGDDAPPELP